MNKTYKLLATAMMAIVLMGFLPVVFAPPTEPHDDAMWIEPSAINFIPTNVSLYQTFDVTIWINVDVIGFTWQVKLTWDPTKLAIVRSGTKATANGVGPEDWLDQRDPGPDLEFQSLTMGAPVYTTSSVLLGGTCAGDDFVPANTVGTLFFARFNITALPEKGTVLECDLDIASGRYGDTFILDTGLTKPTFNAFNAHYRNSWVPPPSPHLAVDPTYREFGPFPPSVIGTTFTENIVLKGYNSAWYIHNATLTFNWNATLLDVLSVAVAPLWTSGSFSIDHINGEVTGTVSNPASNPPSGDVLIATVTFQIIFQDDCVPVGTRAIGDFDQSPITITQYQLFDTTIQIPATAPENGLVKIFCLQSVAAPNLVVSSATMGPAPSVGAEFDVTVSLNNTSAYLYLVGIQFRLGYNDTLIEPVAASEGPFLPSFGALQHTPPPDPTWFVSYFETGDSFPPHVLVGDLILPNSTGMWNAPWPEGAGVIAIITFKVLYQSFGEPDQTSLLSIVDQLAIGLDGPDTQNIQEVVLGPPVDGTYTITTNWPGRMIDVYGGAVNRGYGVDFSETNAGVFPAPYGGQGLGGNMDLVIPQSVVYLVADVTYNYWPVQSKDVGFEIEGPFEQEGWDPQRPVPRQAYSVVKYAARSNESGQAWIKFQMPWPCENPESLFGKYKVTATVDICSVVISDVLWFDYYYLLEIYKITTDKFQYNHCDFVEVTIDFRSKAQQTYPVELSVVIQDNLETHFACYIINTEVGGAQFCHWKNYEVTATIHVPKWAFAGIAKIYISAFDKNPSEGGAPWTIVTIVPEIAIQPY